MSCGTKTKSFKLCRCACRWRCQCLIPREKKPHPAFNVGSKRGGVIGLHPKLYTMSTDTPDVGTYDVQPVRSKSFATNWDDELKAEEFSATMGGKIPQKYITERDVMRRGRGPGTHEIVQWPDDVLHKACKTIKRDVGFGGTVPLFEPSWPSTIPGPGYTKNPYRYIDRRRRRGSSCVPTFEYDGLRPRFPPVTTKSWILPCNLYDAKDPRTLDAVLNKLVSKRGPYDLFTGPRDDSTLRSYQATVKLEDRGDWPKSLPSELDKLLHKSNYFKGRFTTCPRFPKISGMRIMLQDLALSYKDPKLPGPGHYDPKSPRKPTSTKNYPFDINVEFVRPGPSSVLQPGPGRYKIRDTRTIEGNGWTFVFKSKAPRTDFIVIPTYNAF